MLILLNKSPFLDGDGTILDIARRAHQRGEKVGVLHIHDSCIALTLEEYVKRFVETEVGVYALKADCEARGLMKKIVKGVNVVDYKDWVKLLMDEHDRIVSWI